MACFDGATAHQLDFDDFTTTTFSLRPASSATARTELRLALRCRRLLGPDKYKVLDLRRRRAQISARRALGE